MSDAYKKAKPGRLVFKGGEAASLHKPKKHKKSKKPASSDAAPADADAEAAAAAAALAEGGEGASDEYTIDAAKRMKYEELFPVESRKFGYDPANAAKAAASSRSSRTVEEALDDRVRKKADRYCK